MTTFDESLAFEEAILDKVEDGDYAEAEAMLDDQIAKLSDEIADIEKSKKHSKAPPRATDEEDLQDFGVDEEEEANAKKMAMLEHDTDALVSIAKAANGGSGNHDLREAALAKTLADVEANIAKLGGLQPVRYPHGTDTDLQQHSNMTNTVTRTSESGQASRQLSVTPAVQNPGRHAFDDKVDAVRARDGGSRLKAFTTARLEAPGLYESYQAWHSGNTTQEQRQVQQETTDFTNKFGSAHFRSSGRGGNSEGSQSEGRCAECREPLRQLAE